eukprot:1139475-Pelagomonas_calceolata.AAC.5
MHPSSASVTRLDVCVPQDPIIRYGAMYVLGMAYRGTSNNGAVQKLLHFAVSDVSDDVRRAAVLCLGFVLMNAPQQCPRIVALLAESFNPHVRCVTAPLLHNFDVCSWLGCVLMNAPHVMQSYWQRASYHI